MFLVICDFMADDKFTKKEFLELMERLNQLISIGSDLIKLNQERQKGDLYDLAMKSNRKILRGITNYNTATIRAGLVELSRFERRLVELEQIEKRRASG